MCICVLVFNSLSFPHITALCLPVSLYSIPYPPFIPRSQPKLQCVSPVSSFSVHFFKARSLFSPLLAPLSKPHWSHLHRHWSDLGPQKKSSFWINIADDTFNISLQQSSVIVATCKKICYFQYQLMNPSVFFFPFTLFLTLSDERENWSFLQSYFLMQCRFDKARGYQDPKEKCLAVNRMTLALTAVS